MKGPDVDINLPKANIDVKAPDVDIKGPDVDIEGPNAKLKGPKFSMPTLSGPKISMPDVDFNLKGPKLKGDVDVNVPKAKADIKTPDIDIKAPEIDIEGPKGGFEMPKFNMPSLNIKGPKFESPDVDINLKGTKLKGDMDVNLPKIKGDIKAPDVDIEGPDIDIEGHKGGIKMPKFKMPSFGMKGPDVDINLPKANIDVKAPDVDIKGPDVDIEGPNAKLKGPKFSMPTLSGPKISMPDVDFNLKGPKLKGDVDVNVPKAKADIKTPDIDIKAPEIDIEGPKGGFEMPKINMPSLNIKGPKFESPDVDINLKGTKLEGDMDVKVPKIKGDIKAPDVDIEGPDIDIEGHKGGIKMPKFKMPAFGLKGQKLEGPDVDINLPKANIDVKAPDVDIKGPEVDIEGPNAKLKGPKFNMPSLSGSKISMPDVDFNLKGPKLKGDVDVSVPKIEGNIRSPEIDIQGPEFNVEGQKGGLELPKIRMPSFGSKGPNLAGVDVDIDFPKAELEGPDVKIDVKDMSPKKSKFKMPKVGFKSPKIKGPETDVKLEHGEINIKGTSGSLENIDLDVGISGSKTKGSKFKMPKFGLKAPKVDMPEVDLNLPKSGAEINTPDIKIAAPEVNIESSSGSLKGPKVKLPDITGPKISMPDMELNLKGPEIKTDGVKGSDVDIGLPQACGADVDFESPGGKIKGPHFKMPNISGPQISMPDLDFKLKGSKLEGDVSAPKIEGKISTPKTDIKVPEVDIDGSKGGLKMPQIKMPSVDIKGPRMDSSDVTISLPKSNINTGEPKVDIKVPDVDVVGPDAKLNVSKLKMTTTSGSIIPDWDISLKTPKLEGDMDVSKTKLKITTPEVDIKGPKLDIEVPKGGSELPKIKLPSGPEVDVNLPKADIDMKACEMNIKAPEVEKGSCSDHEKTGITFPKFKGPKFAMKSPEIEGSKSTTKAPILSVGAKDSKTEVNFPDTEASLDAPDIDINVKGKKGKFKIPKVKGKAKKPEVDIETTEVDVGVDTPNIHSKGAKAKKSIFGKLHFPDVEFDIKSPTLKGDGSFSEGFKSPDADLPSVSFNTASDGSGADRANVCLEGQDIKVNTQNISMPSAKGSSEISANVSGSATGGLQYPEGKVTFSKIKVPKFGLLLPKAEGQKDERKGKPELAASAGMHIESPSVSGQVSSQNIEIPSPELKHSEGKVKVKMPKLFGKSKAKGSSTGDLHESEAVLSTSGKESKTSKIHSGELIGGKFELEGDPGISVSTKGKSASLDLFKKSKHQSPSLTNEGSLAVSSPSAHLEAEGGDISLDLGGSKVKDKKGKLKFGTFGGFGSKSKGSYEVTLGGDSEAGMEGSVDVSVPSKKSRLSSSSSSDSGSKSGLKFPK
uniref:AHNAK nucleoprotein n=2 Tax=Kryptolebias marmoratus TaxID=37003 RepID=A0A3Q3ADH0_KRYMA